MRKLSIVMLFVAAACGSKPKPAATTPAPAPETAANVACDSPPCDQAAAEPAPVACETLDCAMASPPPCDTANCAEAKSPPCTPGVDCRSSGGNVSAEPARITLPPFKCDNPDTCTNQEPAAACDSPSGCVNKAPKPCEDPAGCV